MTHLLVLEGGAGKGNEASIQPTLGDLCTSEAVAPLPLLHLVPGLAVNNLQDVEVVQLVCLDQPA